MMLGLGGSFCYEECGECGSLWLKDVPRLDDYYPKSYYSFRTALAKPGIASRLIAFSISELQGRHLRRLLKRFRIALGPQDKILDVGCGNGTMLRSLRRHGFKSLTGIDAFLNDSVEAEGLSIRRATIAEIEGTYDLIVFNHSLEHVPDIDATLRDTRKHLSPGGNVLVRMPVPEYAWKTFGRHWFSLDAPRHLHLVTRAGFAKIAERNGYEIGGVIFDSGPAQFWGSRAYQRGETLAQTQPAGFFPLAWHVAKRVVWQPKAWWLNQRGLGDQAAFLLRVAEPR
jgi:SAM-dependent methyltransferase